MNWKSIVHLTAHILPKLLRRSAIGFFRERFKVPLLIIKCVHQQHNTRGQHAARELRVKRAWRRGYGNPVTTL